MAYCNECGNDGIVYAGNGVYSTCDCPIGLGMCIWEAAARLAERAYDVRQLERCMQLTAGGPR